MATLTPYITAKQAAEEVGLSYPRMRQLLQQGRVHGAIKPQRDWLIPRPVEILPPQTTPTQSDSKPEERTL